MLAMDETASLWAIGIMALLLGIALGAMVTYSMVARNNRTHKLQRELAQLSERFTDYRDQVGQHFMHTSDLVKEMTRSYRAVYEHLATGAHHLCAEDPEAPALGHQKKEQLAAQNTEDMVTSEANYDDLEELSSLRKDIDELLGEAPRISDLDVRFKSTNDTTAQH